MTRNAELFETARRWIPGGVNSPVRAFAAVGGTPLFIESASGARLRDAEGREFIDYVGSWGPMLLGHAHPEVVEAVRQAAARGTSYGAPTEGESLLAERVAQMLPSVEKLRLVNSGTEATMSAVRLARGATGREKFIKFQGCYHGHGDAFLIAAGSGAATLGRPDSPGVTEGAARDTLLARYNDLESVRACFASAPGQVAALIVEPIAGNMGMVAPVEGFLEGLRALCDEHGALLIFDEVMSGFRVAPGGAQQRYGVRPDLTTLGKILGGGLPLGAYGGRADIMDQLAPAGPVYQAGTLSGNPLAVAAGLATLRLLEEPGFYDALEEKSRRLAEGAQECIRRSGAPCRAEAVGSMQCLFFHPEPVRNWDDAARCDTEAYGRYFHAMLHQGIYLAPSQYECVFLSAAHRDQDIDNTLGAMEKALRRAFKG